MTTAVLGLGSSLGNRVRWLRMAVAALHATGGIEVRRVSRTVISRGLGPARGAFLNAAVSITTSMQPLVLLDCCKRIEARLGRRRARRWGDRAIDIDILLLGSRTVQETGLVIPHVEFLSRPFALVPAVEVAPDLVVPPLKCPLHAVPVPDPIGIWAGPGLGGRLAGIRWVR